MFLDPLTYGGCTMGTLCSKRVDKLETMFFWAFQAYSIALYDFKWDFCKKKIWWFRTFFKILNRQLEVDIDPTVSNGVPLELY